MRHRAATLDREAGVHKAMLLFWRHGYEGTSVHALTAAMGWTVPSLYRAFGDKRRLFGEAVRLYRARQAVPVTVVDDAATARDAVRDLLRRAAEAFTGADTPPGCLLATAAISCSPEAAEVQAELAAPRRELEAHLQRRLRAAAAAGELPADLDAAGLARLAMAVIQGMSTLARDGAGRDELLALADATLAGWPEPTRGTPRGVR